jgi:hypothetical protein
VAKNKGRKRRNTCSGVGELSILSAACTVRTFSDDIDRSSRSACSPASDMNRRPCRMSFDSHQQESKIPSPLCSALQLPAVPFTQSLNEAITPVNQIIPSSEPIVLPTLSEGARLKRRPPPLQLGSLSNHARRSLGAGISPIVPLFNALDLVSPEYGNQIQRQELCASQILPLYRQPLPSTRPPSLILPHRDPGWTDTPVSAGPAPSPFAEWTFETAQEAHPQAMGPGPHDVIATLEAFNALGAAAKLGTSCQWSQAQDYTPHF